MNDLSEVRSFYERSKLLIYTVALREQKVHPIYYLRPSWSCSLLVVTQIWGHSKLFSPLPATVGALYSYREKHSALSALVDWRLI